MNYAVILAGGAGSRFWPLSRKHLPKQFLKIVEKESLLEVTLGRIRQIIPRANIFIITNKIYLAEIKKQSKGFRIPKENIILEPQAKNTLPAIALCAQIINLKDGDANLLISPSDHYIKDGRAFKGAIAKALEFSARGFLCLVGIKPDKPRSGYGYIQTKKLARKDVFYVSSFREKPSTEEASLFFKKKNVYWNSGIFCFKSKVILSEIKKYSPELYSQISNIRNKSNMGNIWQKVKAVSIDYGILEKSQKLIMVRGRFYWCDLGSWDALSDVLPKDRRSNVVLSDCDRINLDTRGTFICSYNHKRLIAAVGLEDLIIVDTPDALLVCKKEKAQDIKKLVSLLEKKRRACV